MNCTRCDREVAAHVKFCGYCGEQVAAGCPSCGVLNPPDGLFCHDCGHSLTGREEPPSPEERQPQSTGSVCPRCRTTNEPGSAYCYQCGLPLEGACPEDTRRYTRAPGQSIIRRHVPMQRVLFMSVVSAGLYLLYWFYLTWKQFRDSTGREAYPVWHALTLLVPIYGLFRTHAHMRVYSELMSTQNLATTISPGWAVVAVLVSGIVSGILPGGGKWGIPDTQLDAQIQLFMTVASVVIIAWLLLHVQGNLNRYWSRRYGSVASSPLGVVEVILAIIGLMVWANTIVSVVSESYRLGFVVGPLLNVSRI